MISVIKWLIERDDHGAAASIPFSPMCTYQGLYGWVHCINFFFFFTT